MHDSQDDPVRPRGLWYSLDRQWFEYFSKYSDEIKNCKYVYKLKLRYIKNLIPDPKRILRINNEPIFDEFTLKYGLVEKWDLSDVMYTIHIDWKKVAKDYGGVEMIPLLESRKRVRDKSILQKYNSRFKFTDDVNKKDTTLYFWHIYFDIGSGCVWNPDALKKIKRIYKI